MKHLLFVFCAIALVACSAPAAAPTATPASNVSAMPTARATTAPAVATTLGALLKTLIVAHRGGAALAPENTLGAFENAIKLGVDLVECDVHLSKDGEVVVMHDPSVSRTTDGNGPISELTLTELKKLNAAAKFSGGYAAQGVPTLAELLDLVKGKVGLQIEIKLAAGNKRYPGIERKVIDLVNARGMSDEVIVISFDFPTLKEIKTIEPRIKTGALVRADWFTARGNHVEPIVKDALDATGADYFMPTFAPVTEALVKVVHARGSKIGVWTVNTAPEMQRLAGWNVNAITSDRPDELKRVLGR